MERSNSQPLRSGIKQSIGGLHALNAMIAKCRNSTRIYGAQDDLLFCSYLLGVNGAISAILTIFPEQCVKQWEAVITGNIEGAKLIQVRLLPVWQLVISDGMYFPGRLKAILITLGRNGGLPRRPILEPSTEIVEQLHTALQHAKLLPDQ